MFWNFPALNCGDTRIVGVTLSALFALVACAPHKQTGYLDIGNRLDFRQLVSQHGAPFGDLSTVRLVVYADSMAGNRMVHGVFSLYTPACFNAGTVAFVGDVSGMPSFITRMAAVPMMQNYNYPVWLDYDGAATRNIPVLEDQVSLISVEDGRMTSISYAHGAAGIAKAISDYCEKLPDTGETSS